MNINKNDVRAVLGSLNLDNLKVSDEVLLKVLESLEEQEEKDKSDNITLTRRINGDTRGKRSKME